MGPGEVEIVERAHPRYIDGAMGVCPVQENRHQAGGPSSLDVLLERIPHHQGFGGVDPQELDGVLEGAPIRLPRVQRRRRHQQIDLGPEAEPIELTTLLALLPVGQHGDRQPGGARPAKRGNGVLEHGPAGLVALEVPGEERIRFQVTHGDVEKLAYALPALLGVPGVGEKKLEDYGRAFLEAISATPR